MKNANFLFDCCKLEYKNITMEHILPCESAYSTILPCDPYIHTRT